ncbi:MAG: HEPN domain-containing protein [Actinobacteria bacterium]|nr:HEPN domain-containing protein [Actinomycetota bacterium]NDI19338.1 HEPN domain-containing protein [Actinomycetota bacterium]
MSPSFLVRQHLDKAEEFLAAARLGLEAGLPNATASNAVLSGINSKDAICLALTSRTSKSQNHLQAVDELRRAGRGGRNAAPLLQRLLQLKSKSQYENDSVSARDATSAVAWATRLFEAACEIANG